MHVRLDVAVVEVRARVLGDEFIGESLAGHDGELRTSDDSTKELGLRVLFREAAEIGFRITDRNSVSVVLDHISNGGLADENEGLDNFGLRYSYIFGG